ncbi:hypothetical protein QE419_000048 [Brevundimonas vesicularis]|nr:hypothetical protein [Brevundimonas vesicularis]
MFTTVLQQSTMSSATDLVTAPVSLLKAWYSLMMPSQVQALVAHRPGHDLAHALHLVLAREVHQHGEGREQLNAFREAAEHGQGPADVGVGIDPELAHIVVLVPHGLIFHEGAELALGHADGFKQQGVGRDMDRLHIAESGQHHLHLGRFEHPAVAFHVVVLNLDVRLGEEAEDLGQQVAFAVVQGRGPVLDVLAQRHLLGHPVDLLLLLPHVERPRIAERLVGGRRGQKTGALGEDDRSDGVHRTGPEGDSEDAFTMRFEDVGAKSK